MGAWLAPVSRVLTHVSASLRRLDCEASVSTTEKVINHEGRGIGTLEKVGGNDWAVVMQREDPESSKPDWPVQDNFEARFQVKVGEREDWGKKAHQSHLICDEVLEGSWEQKRTA